MNYSCCFGFGLGSGLLTLSFGGFVCVTTCCVCLIVLFLFSCFCSYGYYLFVLFGLIDICFVLNWMWFGVIVVLVGFVICWC